jgi:hypothetical protein
VNGYRVFRILGLALSSTDPAILLLELKLAFERIEDSLAETASAERRSAPALQKERQMASRAAHDRPRGLMGHDATTIYINLGRSQLLPYIYDSPEASRARHMHATRNPTRG